METMIPSYPSQNVYKLASDSSLVVDPFPTEQNYLLATAEMYNTNSEQKTYHKKASGLAWATVKRHSKDHDLKLFGSCFW